MDAKYRYYHFVFAISCFILGPVYSVILHYLYESSKDSNVSYIIILINALMIGILTITISILLPVEIMMSNSYINVKILFLRQMLASDDYPTCLYTMIGLLPWNLTNLISVIVTGDLATVLGIITLITFPGSLTFTIGMLLLNLRKEEKGKEEEDLELIVNTAG